MYIEEIQRHLFAFGKVFVRFLVMVNRGPLVHVVLAICTSAQHLVRY